MKSKLKKIAISFISILIVHLLISSDIVMELGMFSPHVGLLYVLGLLFGPYGALGAVLANIIVDFMEGYAPIEILPSAICSFGISYLAYKLWYSGFKTDKITKPNLDSTYHLLLFLSSILICGFCYSVIHGALIGILMDLEMTEFVFIIYFFDFITAAFIFGIIGLWLSKKISFTATPETSERQPHEKLYRILFYLLIIVSLVTLFSITQKHVDMNMLIVETILFVILLFGYLTKPFKYKIAPYNKNTIIEKIIRNFLIITLAIGILGIIISISSYNFVENINNINVYIYLMPGIIITDAIIILFFIPGIVILRYVENKVIKPISSFSEIENFIKENEKIEAEGLVEVYSKYIDEKTEIGTLARSYTNLINHNNNYIENIREIEGEKERINAELDIATKIQAAALPTESLETDDFIVNGYSKPAKEVGGDFFDYYQLDDDNLAIVIGDASGKGVPAALLAMITQVIIKQTLKHEKNPAKVLYTLNNQLSENNPESMFLTLWLGIYNRTTEKLTFSNAGHNPPLMRKNGKFEYLNINNGIVLGIMEDFDYVKEDMTLADELVIYTDGITDANNDSGEMYGEDRLLNFFNGFESDDDPIVPLLDNIAGFTKEQEQFDDMTLLYLKIK